MSAQLKKKSESVKIELNAKSSKKKRSVSDIKATEIMEVLNSKCEKVDRELCELANLCAKHETHGK